MRKATFLLLIVAALTTVTIAQRTKPWTEWAKKDVDKMLNESPWGQTQTETDTSQMTYSPTSDKTAMSVDGANNQAVDFKYHIMFFSAKPIREAFARRVLLSNPAIKPEQLNNFINGDYSESIVVAVIPESKDARYLRPIEEAMKGSTVDTLKNNTYLERNDGKRVFLEDYAPPGSDGTGAKLQFPRTFEGKPFLTSDSSVRVVSSFGKGVKVSWKFKLSDMMYDGKLEF